MSESTKSNPELQHEAEEAQRVAGLTMGWAQQLLNRAREVGHEIEARVRQAAGSDVCETDRADMPE